MTFLPLTILISGIFFIFKLANVGVRLSDTNVYFYTAQELLKGKILYKDIFFTNLPLFPYWSSLYTVFHNISFYYLTSAIEVIISGLLIYYIVWIKTKNSLLAFLGNCLYLGSFIILSTSDHQTGIFLATLLSLVSYLLYLKNKRFLTGVFLGLMVCMKAYYLPILVAFIFYDLIKNRQKSTLIFIGTLVSIAIILSPFIIITHDGLIKSVFQYSLTRPQGIDKLPIFIFFITKDFLLFVGFIFSFINLKKDKLIFLICLFSLILILFYKDIYYLYLNILVPFLIFSFLNLFLSVNVKMQKHTWIIVGVFLTLSIFVYGNSFYRLQKVDSFEDMVLTIKNQKPPVIYGIEELTTALSYESKIPLLDGLVDTNENLFNSRVLDAKTLTEKAINQNAMVILKGAIYPQQNINDLTLTNIIDKKLFLSHCFLLKKYPVISEGIVNTITFFQCKKPLD
jgi:hypothetical protein